MPSQSIEQKSVFTRRQLLQHGAGATVAAALSATPFGSAAARAEEGVTFSPFDPDKPTGQKPDLPRVFAYLGPARAEMFLGVESATRLACEKKGIEFVSAYYDGDEAKYVQLFESFLARGIGAMTFFGTNPAATLPLQQRALDAGIFLQGWVAHHVHQVVDFDQRGLGRTMTLGALDFINGKLGGKANVAIFNLDSIEMLQPRYAMMREVLRSGGSGIEIVSDITQSLLTSEAGQNATNTLLQAHPDLNVIITPAALAPGVYAALAAAGREHDDSFGIISETPSAVDLDLVAKGGIYRCTTAAGVVLWGYAAGLYAADWFDGKSVPQALKGPNYLLDTPEKVKTFIPDMADPGSTWDDPDKRDHYAPRFGNISYATRSAYLKRPWLPPSDY